MNNKIIYNTFFLVVLFLISHLNLNAQISGTVTNHLGESLPFVNVYVEGTTLGTSTNVAGIFEINPPDNNRRLVFQFIGYKNQYLDLKKIDRSQSLDIIMLQEKYELSEVTIAADAEDPAYAIIRKAQSKRSYYKNKDKEYSCSVYVKGNQKVLDAPNKILGITIGDMEGLLDTNRQGIVYLSESVSKLYRKDKEIKEVMISSKVSGDDQGYSFNSAREMEMDFYDKSIELTRQMVNPIAPNAMAFYKYKLLGSYFTEEGFEINRIQVIPKQNHLPVFSGELFIKEDSWNIYALDLTATKDGLDIPFIDSLNIVQNYVPGPEDDQWLKLSNIISFRLGGFGFDFRGTFAANYSDYDLSPMSSDFFNHEVYYIEDEANKRTETYWDSLRPIPLIKEEVSDYIRKDSIQKVKESPEYLDSIDRDHNKFEITDIIGGYSWQNSQKKSSFDISSPLSHISYNTVQGFIMGMSVDWRKRRQKNKPGNFYLRGYADYGFSEKTIRPRLTIGAWESSQNNFSWNISGGSRVQQFNSRNPISDIQNLYETLFERENILKLYQEEYAQLKISSYLNHWIKGTLSTKYARRSPLVNNSDFSLFNRDINFSINSPIHAFGQEYQFEPYNILLLETKLSFYPYQKTHRHPEYTTRIRNRKYPIISLEFKKAFESTSFNTDASFNFMELALKDDIPIGAYGNLSYYMAHGRFFGEFKGATLIDLAYFMSNESFDIQSKGTERFLALPYNVGTNGSYYQINLEHDFQGLIFDRIPGFRNLGWQLLLGTRHLKFENNNTYSEYSIGIDNIGFGNFKLFQIHGVWTDANNGDDFRIVLGIKSDL